MPLTEGAKMALELAKDDPDAKAMVEAAKAIAEIEMEMAQSPPYPPHSAGYMGGASEETEVAPAPTAPPQKKSLFSSKQVASILKTSETMSDVARRQAEEEQKKADLAQQKEDAKKQYEEEKRQQELREAEEKRKALIASQQAAYAQAKAMREKFKNKTFLFNQDARRFHNAMKPDNAAGWICNYADVIHPPGPNDCYKPSDGGYWFVGDVYEDEEGFLRPVR
jgi:hypothetical protein